MFSIYKLNASESVTFELTASTVAASVRPTENKGLLTVLFA
jgi:hypothetical protein